MEVETEPNVYEQYEEYDPFREQVTGWHFILASWDPMGSAGYFE